MDYSETIEPELVSTERWMRIGPRLQWEHDERYWQASATVPFPGPVQWGAIQIRRSGIPVAEQFGSYPVELRANAMFLMKTADMLELWVWHSGVKWGKQRPKAARFFGHRFQMGALAKAEGVLVPV